MAVIMMPKVIRDIMEIIRKHHAAIAALMFGRSAVSDDEWKDAVSLGVVEDESESLLAPIHEFGGWVAHNDASDDVHRTMSMTAATSTMRRRPRPPRTQLEYRAAEHALQSGAQYCRGLGNRASATTGAILINADDELAERMRGRIRDAVAANLGDVEAQRRLNALAPTPGFYDDAFRGTTKRVVSDIGHATKDWSRDLHRIAVTEGHNALQDGLAEGMIERAGGGMCLVFKIPQPSACSHCVDLHLDGGVPRIFDLRELQVNGSNEGRKASEWRAVVGSVHPNCRCSLSKVPSLLSMPRKWRSGDTAPTVVGPGGRLVMP